MRVRSLLTASLISSTGAIAAVLGSPSAANADPPCLTNGGVYVVFVRGSQEKIYDKRARAFHDALIGASGTRGAINWLYPGLVSTGWVEIGNLDGDVQPGEPQNESGEYPAVGPIDWGINSGMDGYYKSVWTGVSELRTHLNDRANRCPRESIVVGGYSQGAEVLGYALAGISDYTRSHIGYAAFYGDPRSNNRCGQAGWSRGSAWCAHGFLGMREPYVPAGLTDRSGSWCDSYDGVCTGRGAYLPLPGNTLSSHSSAYDSKWIQDSVDEIANRAISKRNVLNPKLSPMMPPPFSIVAPLTAIDSPAAPPIPVIKSVKRRTDHVGTYQLYAATKSAVTEAWWHPGQGVQTKEMIHISQGNIVGFDKVNEPDGTTQSLYTAVPDGVWETWWRPGDGPHSSKIVTGLTGVRQVIADPVVESGQYTHRLYLLAEDGPYEVWWRDGGDGIHVSRLDNIAGPVTMAKSTGPDGTDQLYVATPSVVYELWWRPGQGVNYNTILHIAQGDIRSLDKGANLPDGGQLLYTGTSTTGWQTYWNGTTGVSPAHGTITVGQTNAGQIKKTVTGGVHQLYQTNGCRVQENWWNGPSSGSSTLIDISQCNITSFDKSADGPDQQVYTASGDLVYETWWRGGSNPSGPNTSVLFKVGR